MKIDLDEARRVAALAALEFGEPDLAQVAGEMSRILDYVDQIESVDVSSVAEAMDVSPSVCRADEARSSQLAGEVEQNAPSMLRGHFVVPKVIGGE